MAVESRFYEGTPDEISSSKISLSPPSTTSIRYVAGTNPSVANLSTPVSASTTTSSSTSASAGSLSPSPSDAKINGNANGAALAGRERSTSVASSSTTSLGAPVSQKRQDEFEKFFADKLKEEQGQVDMTVLATQSADLQAKVLIHGRLYLTSSHLCFRSNILGFRTERIHRLKSVKSVKKGTTAKWIQNAIYVAVDDGSAKRERSGSNAAPQTSKQVVAAGTKTGSAESTDDLLGEGEAAHGMAGYGSLGDRDAMYESVINCWRIEAPERYNTMMEHLAEDSSIAEEDEGEDEDLAAGASGSAEKETGKDNDEDEQGDDVTDDTATETIKNNDDGVKHTECSGDHFKELALDAKIPLTPEKVYNLIYHNPKFIQEFYEQDQKLTDVNISEWKEEDGEKKRDLKSVMHMNMPIGPSKSASLGVERVKIADPEKAYEIVSESRTPDVPSGKSFVIRTRTCLTHDDINGKPATRMYCTTQCDWTSSSWLKSKIGPAVIKGQKEYHQKLMKKIRAWVKEHPEEFKSAKSGKSAGAKAKGGKSGKREAKANAEGQAAEEKGFGEDDPQADVDADDSDDSDDGFEVAEDDEPAQKSLMDHAAAIPENPVMLAITALCAVLLLITLYQFLFSRHVCPTPDMPLLIPESRLEMLEHRIERVARHLLGDAHEVVVGAKGRVAVKV